MPSYLKPISDYAAKLYSQGKALMTPEDEEAKAFAEKQQQIDAAMGKQQPQQPEAPPRMSAPAPTDRINTMGRYGSRPGEVRPEAMPDFHMVSSDAQPHPAYDEGGDVPKMSSINSHDGKHQMILAEEGERVLDPQETKEYDREHGTKKPMMAKVYDEGGDVDAAPSMQEAGITPTQMPDLGDPSVPQPDASLGTKLEAGLMRYQNNSQGTPNLPTNQADSEMLPDSGRAPRLGWAYDEGGDVQKDNPEQMKVDPVEPMQDLPDAPLNEGTFVGRVDERPRMQRLTPKADTDAPDTEYDKRYSNMDNSNPPKTAVDEFNPPAAKGGLLREMSAHPQGMQPLPGTKPMTVAPEVKPTGEPTVAAPDPMDVVHQDKLAAMKSGDTVALGKALINERLLKPEKSEQTPAVGPELVPPTEEKPTLMPSKQASAQDQQAYKAKLADYDQRIQAAMDAGTPEGEREAASLGLAKAHFEKINPYGSAGNHPGILGKVEHGLAEAGNIAGNLVAGPELAHIPGTQLNKRVQEERLRGQEQAASKQVLEEAQAKQASVGSKLPPPTQVFDDLKGQINPETQKGGPLFDPKTPNGRPYTDQERLDIAQNPGKSGEVTWARKYMADHQGATYEEGVEDYYKMKAGNKPLNEHEKRVADYVASHNMEDTPANRETARQDIEKTDADIKQLVALPYAKQKAQFSSNLAESRQRLQQANADSYSRGLEADKLQNVENARYNKVNGQ